LFQATIFVKKIPIAILGAAIGAVCHPEKNNKKTGKANAKGSSFVTPKELIRPFQTDEYS